MAKNGDVGGYEIGPDGPKVYNTFSVKNIFTSSILLGERCMEKCVRMPDWRFCTARTKSDSNAYKWRLNYFILHRPVF